MDRLARFRRRKSDLAAAASATSVAAEDKASESKAPAPAPPTQALVPPSRPREKHTLSPFRSLRLRTSIKRARESPPAALPLSPSAAVHQHHDDHRVYPRSPLSTRKDASQVNTAHAQQPKPKIPSFLTLSNQEIRQKFHDLDGLEDRRILQGLSNPPADPRWERVLPLRQIKELDRYKNIQPWENNRVRLKVPTGHLDYINASPITLTTTAPSHVARPIDRYIAMQGPIEASRDHVWRMVVEQLRSPAVIVMLTETHEANMEKCHPYFPRTVEEGPMEINEGDEFEDGFRASVRCEAIEQTPAGDAIELRKLVIRVRRKRSHIVNGTNGTRMAHNGMAPDEHDEPEGDGDVTMKSSEKHDPLANGEQNADHLHNDNDVIEEEKIVYHFLYKKWPDFGVPAIDDLDSFFTLMCLSRDKNADADNPRIVHCSAGVGRSGTFIALEHLMRELDAGVLENYDKRPAAKSGRPDGSDDEDIYADDEGEDLVFSTVNQLREQRRTMVQAPAQYTFIYQVMSKLWQDKYGVVDEQTEPAAKRLEVDPFVEN